MTQNNLRAFVLTSSLVTALAMPAAHGQTTPYTKPAAISPTTKPAAGAPSIEELQSNLDQKQYPAAVKLASKMLAMHGPAASSISRFQVTMLKGEAQVGMKSMSAAAATFRSALKETKDPHELALAKWTGELFARAKGTTYVPKTIGAGQNSTGPIDLMDHDKRKDAFAAMLDDDLSALSPKLKSAVVSRSLPEIWPVLEKVISLDQLDVIANGNDDKTAEVASSLLDHSRNLLSNALKGMWARVGDIDNHANVVTNFPSTVVINGQYVTQNVSKKNGLSDGNKTELTNDIEMSTKIHDAAEEFLPLAKTDKDWGAILNDADRVAGRASDILNADYGSAVSQGTGTTYDNTGLNGQSTGSQVPQFPGGTLPQIPHRPVPNKTAKTDTVTKSN